MFGVKTRHFCTVNAFISLYTQVQVDLVREKINVRLFELKIQTLMSRRIVRWMVNAGLWSIVLPVLKHSSNKICIYIMSKELKYRHLLKSYLHDFVLWLTRRKKENIWIYFSSTEEWWIILINSWFLLFINFQNCLEKGQEHQAKWALEHKSYEWRQCCTCLVWQS